MAWFDECGLIRREVYQFIGQGSVSFARAGVSSHGRCRGYAGSLICMRREICHETKNSSDSAGDRDGCERGGPGGGERRDGRGCRAAAAVAAGARAHRDHRAEAGGPSTADASDPELPYQEDALTPACEHSGECPDPAPSLPRTSRCCARSSRSCSARSGRSSTSPPKPPTASPPCPRSKPLPPTSRSPTS